MAMVVVKLYSDFDDEGKTDASYIFDNVNRIHRDSYVLNP